MRDVQIYYHMLHSLTDSVGHDVEIDNRDKQDIDKEKIR
jgi:hypothetical protein